MMGWIPFAAVAAVALASADLLVKIASGRISSGLAMLLYGGCALLCGLALMGRQRLAGIPLTAELAGSLAATGVGLAFSTVTVCLYLTFERGAPLSVASPMIRLASLLLASLAGISLLQERVTPRYVVGIILAVLGIALIVAR